MKSTTDRHREARTRRPPPAALAGGRSRVRRRLSLPLVAAALLGGCFVNEMQESAGNQAHQDSGLHVRLHGNFILNRDGSRVVTTAVLERGDRRECHLIGLTLPGLMPVIGPSVEGLSGPEIMLTPSPDAAWLVGTRHGRLDIAPLALDTMALGAPLALPDEPFNAAILSGDGRRLLLGEVWNAHHARSIALFDLPTPPSAGGPASPPLRLAVPGALFDARFTRLSDRLVVLSVPIDGEGHFARAATLSVYDTATAGAAPLVATVELPGFALNLLGLLTWSVRITPDGQYAAVSGRQDDADTTHVIRLDDGAYHGAFPCDGPVGFGPDSRTMVGFRDQPGQASELVVSDLIAGTSDSAPLDYRNPVYWITPDGGRVVTYPFYDRGLVITDLDSLEVTETRGDKVALREFAVSPDGDFVYLVDGGGLYLLDLELGEVSALEPESRAYDNLNILPGGDALVLSADGTERFDLWSVTTGRTERTMRLPTRL